MFARTTARTIYYHLPKKLNGLINYTGKRKEESGTPYLWMAWTIELHSHCPWCPSSVPSVQTVLQIFKLTDLWRFRLTFGCSFSYTTILSRTRDHKVAFGQYTYTPCWVQIDAVYPFLPGCLLLVSVLQEFCNSSVLK